MSNIELSSLIPKDDLKEAGYNDAFISNLQTRINNLKLSQLKETKFKDDFNKQKKLDTYKNNKVWLLLKLISDIEGTLQDSKKERTTLQTEIWQNDLDKTPDQLLTEINEVNNKIQKETHIITGTIETKNEWETYFNKYKSANPWDNTNDFHSFKDALITNAKNLWDIANSLKQQAEKVKNSPDDTPIKIYLPWEEGEKLEHEYPDKQLALIGLRDAIKVLSWIDDQNTFLSSWLWSSISSWIKGLWLSYIGLNLLAYSLHGVWNFWFNIIPWKEKSADWKTSWNSEVIKSAGQIAGFFPKFRLAKWIIFASGVVDNFGGGWTINDEKKLDVNDYNSLVTDEMPEMEKRITFVDFIWKNTDLGFTNDQIDKVRKYLYYNKNDTDFWIKANSIIEYNKIIQELLLSLGKFKTWNWVLNKQVEWFKIFFKLLKWSANQLLLRFHYLQKSNRTVCKQAMLDYLKPQLESMWALYKIESNQVKTEKRTVDWEEKDVKVEQDFLKHTLNYSYSVDPDIDDESKNSVLWEKEISKNIDDYIKYLETAESKKILWNRQWPKDLKERQRMIKSDIVNLAKWMTLEDVASWKGKEYKDDEIDQFEKDCKKNKENSVREESNKKLLEIERYRQLLEVNKKRLLLQGKQVWWLQNVFDNFFEKRVNKGYNWTVQDFLTKMKFIFEWKSFEDVSKATWKSNIDDTLKSEIDLWKATIEGYKTDLTNKVTEIKSLDADEQKIKLDEFKRDFLDFEWAKTSWNTDFDNAIKKFANQEFKIAYNEISKGKYEEKLKELKDDTTKTEDIKLQELEKLHKELGDKINETSILPELKESLEKTLKEIKKYYVEVLKVKYSDEKVDKMDKNVSKKAFLDVKTKLLNSKMNIETENVFIEHLEFKYYKEVEKFFRKQLSDLGDLNEVWKEVSNDGKLEKLEKRIVSEFDWVEWGIPAIIKDWLLSEIDNHRSTLKPILDEIKTKKAIKIAKASNPWSKETKIAKTWKVEKTEDKPKKSKKQPTEETQTDKLKEAAEKNDKKAKLELIEKFKVYVNSDMLKIVQVFERRYKNEFTNKSLSEIKNALSSIHNWTISIWNIGKIDEKDLFKQQWEQFKFEELWKVMILGRKLIVGWENIAIIGEFSRLIKEYLELEEKIEKLNEDKDLNKDEISELKKQKWKLYNNMEEIKQSLPAEMKSIISDKIKEHSEELKNWKSKWFFEAIVKWFKKLEIKAK